MTRTLYSISDDLMALESLLAESDGDVTGAEDVIDQWFSEIHGDLTTKVDNYAALIREFDQRAAARKMEAIRVADRAKADANAAGRLKERLRVFFDESNIKALETPRFRVTLATNGGKLPAMIPGDPDDVPERYRRARTVIEVDKDAIRQDLEQGVDVEGCCLLPRGNSIRIK